MRVPEMCTKTIQIEIDYITQHEILTPVQKRELIADLNRKKIELAIIPDCELNAGDVFADAVEN